MLRKVIPEYTHKGLNTENIQVCYDDKACLIFNILPY